MPILLSVVTNQNIKDLNKNKLLTHLLENPFLMAPMAGVTDCSFRKIMRRLESSFVVTELISANGLKYNSDKTRELMSFTECQRPVGIQIFGETIENLVFSAIEVEKMGADFVDLNLGCPVKKVVKKGAGSALLKDLPYLTEILKALVSAVNIPVTIKIRTGWDKTDLNADEVCNIAYEAGIAWVAIHGRTRSQAYTGEADWEYIKYVKSVSKIPIIGNGDVLDSDTALKRLNESKCDGIMIGRGCLKNPWIFQEAHLKLSKQRLDKQKLAKPVSKDYLSVLKPLILEYEKNADERVCLLQIKKFSSWFSHGINGSAQLRKNIFSAKDVVEAKRICFNFFEKSGGFSRIEDSHKNFMMSGHG